jgi:hypothetical protein
MERWNGTLSIAVQVNPLAVVPPFIRGHWLFIRLIRVPTSSNEIRRGQVEQFETRIGRIEHQWSRMNGGRDFDLNGG